MTRAHQFNDPRARNFAMKPFALGRSEPHPDIENP
jgi:hypothetical protein